MGVYEKTGIRNIGILVTEYINWIRLYGLGRGSSIFWGLLRNRQGKYLVKLPFAGARIALRNNVSDKAIFKQVFLEKQYVNPFFQIPSASRILDAGANIGASVVWFKHHFPDAAIIAVEPEQHNFEMLKSNAAHFPGITLLQAAIWHKSEPVSIANPHDQAASFNIESATASSIPGMTIDEIMESNKWDTIDVLKMDIEGAEKVIFSQADIPWLNKVKVLIIELHDQLRPGCAKTFFKAIDRLGYNAYFHHENIFVHFD